MRRREMLQALAAAGGLAAWPGPAAAQAGTRAMPSSGERLPTVGLGTWITFDVADAPTRGARGEVLREFLAAGGRMVDSSPMYGAAEEVIGQQYARIGRPPALFSATKVWTVGDLAGRRQMEKSRGLWGVPRFDLLMVHNLLDWQTHLATLRDWKARGRVRYIGVTTSHGRRHDLAEEILRRERIDVIQFTYSLADRSAQYLLPIAAERGVAVVVNRPFDGGDLFRVVAGKPVPDWAREAGCANWAELFLKWIVSHPAVTCAIPATSQVAHLRENMGALSGPLPDAAMRRRIAAAFDRL